MKHESTKYSITAKMIENMSPEDCKDVLEDIDAAFESEMLMRLTADKAGVALVDFYEYHGRAPLHRYEQADYVGNQVDGYYPRVSKVWSTDGSTSCRTIPEFNSWEDEWNEWVKSTYTGEDMESKIDVSKGKLHEAAHGNNTVFVENEVSTVDHYVSGNHYNDVVPGMQYMEMMQYMLEGKSGVEAHLFGQVYKYLMRAGKKDDYEQDIRKARWYTNCLVKYVQTNKIDVENNDG